MCGVVPLRQKTGSEMISRHGLVRSGHAHGLSTGPGRSGQPERRTFQNNYVPGVAAVAGPWGLDEWTKLE